MLLSALAAGGATAPELLQRLKSLGAGQRSAALVFWQQHALRLLEEATATGAPCGALLRETATLARADEKRLSRAAVMEKQFAFQGALLTVLPWCVFSATGALKFNGPLICGVILQMAGLGAFTALAKAGRQPGAGEPAWLRELTAVAWLRVRAGQTAGAALQAAIETLAPGSRQRLCWQQWLDAVRRLDRSTAVRCWHGDMPESRRLGEALARLLEQGAPAGELLFHAVGHCESLREQAWEERLALAPSRLALVMCLFFAPALFCLVASALWDQLEFLL